jgi:hypothetical protein
LAFLAIKNNPFTGLGEQWRGVGARAPEVATYAAAAATEVLHEEVTSRATSYDRWSDDLVSKVRPYQAPDGTFRVGLPDADDEAQQRALEAEYGDEEHKPQPLMRTSTERAKKRAQETFNEVMHQGLFG